MTISSTNNRDDYTGNATTLNYAYTFRVYSKTDMKVYIVETATGISTLATVDVDYTVNNIGETVGTVTLVDAGQDWIDTATLATGFTLALVRNLPYTQPTEFRNQGTFYPESHEDAMDRIVMLAQQLNEKGTRSLTFSEAVDIGSFDTTIPAGLGVAAGAGKLLVVNDTGTGFVEGPTAGNIAAAEANAAAADASAIAAAASQATASIAATTATAAAESGYGRGAIYTAINYQVVTPTDSGQTLVVDASGGAITVTLPLISTLSTTAPFTITVKRDATDTSSNPITISTYLAGTFNEINENGNTTYLLGSGEQSVTLMADDDKASDQWETVAFSHKAGAKGSLIVSSATASEELAVGVNDQALVADSTSSTGLKYGPSIQQYVRQLGLTEYTEHSASSALSWECVASNTTGQGMMAVAPSSATGAMYSNDRGRTWAGQTIASRTYQDIIWSTTASRYVALADSSTTGISTTNGGGTWTSRTTPSKFWQALTDTGSLLVAVNLNGSGGDGAMYSTDAFTWTASTACQDNVWYDVANDGTNIVAVGASGKVSTTTDGDTWTARTDLPSTVDAIAYGNGKFMTLGTECHTSIDGGATWVQVNASLGFSPQRRELRYCDGVWVALMGNYVVTSIDEGVTWQVKRITTSSMEGATYGSGRLVIVQSSGTNRVKNSMMVVGE